MKIGTSSHPLCLEHHATVRSQQLLERPFLSALIGLWLGLSGVHLPAEGQMAGGMFFIEAEDFDFDGGQHLPVADSMPYLGGAYQGRSAQADIDFHNPAANENPEYRPASQGVAIYASGDVYRDGYDARSTFRVAWNYPGEWFNYTRDFPLPAREYEIYARLSSGAGPNGMGLDEVIGGVGTTAQQLVPVGSARGPASGGWDWFLYHPFLDGAGKPVRRTLGGRHTLRLTNLEGGTQDINYLQFVPVGFPTRGHCAPVADGAQAWWPGDGHPRDLVRTNHGTLQNGATFGVGVAGEAFLFDGIDDYVDTRVDVQPGTHPEMTWEGWVFPTRSGLRLQILSADDGGYDRSVLVEGSRFGVFTGWGVWTPVSMSFNQWQHFAAVFSRTNVEFYKNGERFSYNAAPAGQGSRNTLQIGRNPGFGEYFQGRIDEVSIYNRALASAENQTLFTAGSAGKCATQDPRPPPVISAVQPARVSPGDVLSIRGTGFDPVKANNQARINGVPVPIVSATSSELVVLMPTTFSRGPASVVVQVGETASSTAPLTVEGATPVALSAARRGGILILSWPAEAINVALESAPGPHSQAAWTRWNFPPETIGGRQEIRVIPGETAQFFRLRTTNDSSAPVPTISFGRGRVTAAVGGVVSTEDGVAQISVPPGALEQDTDIEVTSVSFAGGDGRPPAGDVFLAPDGLRFSQPATLTVQTPGPPPAGHRPVVQLLSEAHPVLDVGGEGSLFRPITNFTFHSGNGRLEIPLPHFSVGLWSWAKDLYAILELPGRHLLKGDLLYVLTDAKGGQGGDWMPGHCGLYLGTRDAFSGGNDGSTLVESTQTHSGVLGVVRFERLSTDITGFLSLNGTHISMGARRPARFDLTDNQRTEVADWAISKIGQRYLIIGGGPFLSNDDGILEGYTCVGLTELAYEFGAGRPIVPSQAARILFTPFRQFQWTVPVNTTEIKVGESFDCKVIGVVNRGTPVSNAYYTDLQYYTRGIDRDGCDEDALAALDAKRAKFEPTFGLFTFTPVPADGDKDFKFAFIIDATRSGAGMERTAMIVKVEKRPTITYIRQDPPVIRVSTFQGSGSSTNLVVTDREAYTRGPNGTALKLFWEPPPAQVAAGSTFTLQLQSDGGTNPAEQISSITAPPRLMAEINEFPDEFSPRTAFAGYEFSRNCNSPFGSACYLLVTRPASQSITVPADASETADFRGIRLEFRMFRSFGPFNPGEVRGTLEWNYLPAPASSSSSGHR